MVFVQKIKRKGNTTGAIVAHGPAVNGRFWGLSGPIFYNEEELGATKDLQMSVDAPCICPLEC